MVELLLLPFKLAFFLVKLAFGMVFFLLGTLLLPLLVVAALLLFLRWVFC
jgi:hypothetical protein